MGAGGLDGVVVADTALSDVDGGAGRLVLRGHAVEELAGRTRFEEAVALFLGGTAEGVQARLGAARVRAHHRLPALGDALDAGDAMSAVRAALAHEPPTNGGAQADEPFDAIAMCAVAMAAWWCRRARRSGATSEAPDPAAPHAADVLRLVGLDANEHARRALDTYWVTVIDHGMNASTFAARVVASTGSDLRSALVAGVGALKGPLHGGAPGPVLDLLDRAAAAPDAAGIRALIDGELAAGRRIMGMGHRIYRVRDPRAFVLERALEMLLPHVDAGARARLELARRVEREAERALAGRHPDRPLKANVEFFTAVLLDALGCDRALFTPLFCCARAVGWCAHVAEQRATGRLMRPASRYVGP